MTTRSLAQPAHPSTRELRALELYRTRGHEIHRFGTGLYRVPSCSGGGYYTVDYLEETCTCPDFQYRRRENCKHILAVGVHVAKRRRPRPCACIAGVVYIGHLVEDPDTGEEVEVVEPAPCRRCR
ncbi:MAG: SWIM zinc finger domain-containing protein [Actinomycetota bacterium]|nr:SWIM zinc finger domain-containing protein [Actinomycetota bacterium]